MVHPTDAPVIVWTNRGCGACVQAKRLLDRKGVTYTERRLKNDVAVQRAFARATGGARTVPQIIVGAHRVGGFDDLINLDQSGELDVMLGRAEALPRLSFWKRLVKALTG
jgi:glutaredoxin 3